MQAAGYLAVLVLVGIVTGAEYVVPLAGPGIAIGAALVAALSVWLVMSPAMDAARKEAANLRQELERNVTSLRHDLRGILSPALLTADRLLENENPAMRRMAEVVIRTVDRATNRLAETKLGATESASKTAPLERPDRVD
jgi:hypothetical protein